MTLTFSPSRDISDPLYDSIVMIDSGGSYTKYSLNNAHYYSTISYKPDLPRFCEQRGWGIFHRPFICTQGFYLSKRKLTMCVGTSTNVKLYGPNKNGQTILTLTEYGNPEGPTLSEIDLSHRWCFHITKNDSIPSLPMVKTSTVTSTSSDSHIESDNDLENLMGCIQNVTVHTSKLGIWSATLPLKSKPDSESMPDNHYESMSQTDTVSFKCSRHTYFVNIPGPPVHDTHSKSDRPVDSVIINLSLNSWPVYTASAYSSSESQPCLPIRCESREREGTSGPIEDGNLWCQAYFPSKSSTLTVCIGSLPSPDTASNVFSELFGPTVLADADPNLQWCFHFRKEGQMGQTGQEETVVPSSSRFESKSYAIYTAEISTAGFWQGENCSLSHVPLAVSDSKLNPQADSEINFGVIVFFVVSVSLTIMLVRSYFKSKDSALKFKLLVRKCLLLKVNNRANLGITGDHDGEIKIN